MSDYEMLKAAGHSPQKVAEIILDAKRGDKYALTWLDLAKSGAPVKQTTTLADLEGLF